MTTAYDVCAARVRDVDDARTRPGENAYTGVRDMPAHRFSVAANTAADTARLEASAGELQSVLDPIAQKSRASSVLSTREGTDVLTSGGRDRSPAERALVVTVIFFRVSQVHSRGWCSGRWAHT